jgi:hypothetical protein
MTAWWSALAPVTLPLTCSGHDHELRWAEGELSAPAHPDADRERALVALGADPSPCVQILDAWNRHANDLDVLVLASRGPADRFDESRRHFMPGPGVRPFGIQAHMVGYASLSSVRPSGFGWWGSGPMGSRGFMDDEVGPGDELARLLLLSAGLPHRLSATVIAAWAGRIDAGDERSMESAPALDAALYGRLRSALILWLGRSTKLQLIMQPPGADLAVRSAGDTIHLELPFAWLRDVWANGLALVLDRFCLHAERSAPDTWTLTTVDRDLDQRTLTITG